MTDEHKERFMMWLDRFAYAQTLKEIYRKYKFSEEDYLRIKPHIEAHYAVKKEFMKSRGA